MELGFIDTNIWLYRLFDDQLIEPKGRERKRNIAISITDKSNLIISTQVINEISVNLIKKAKFDEAQIKAVIQSLYHRCQVVKFDLTILESASDLQYQCQTEKLMFFLTVGLSVAKPNLHENGTGIVTTIPVPQCVKCRQIVGCNAYFSVHSENLARVLLLEALFTLQRVKNSISFIFSILPLTRNFD